MSYPTISEYIEAIRYAEDNLATLTHLRPVLDKDGNPVMSSGNFAVVFKMQDDSGRFYALKCFTREQEGRAEAYKIICDELAKIASPYFVQTEYYDRELFVNTHQSTETEFPVLLMDWVEGITLNHFFRIEDSIWIDIHNWHDAPYGTDFTYEIFSGKCGYSLDDNALHELSYNFNCLVRWLLKQDFAHGDLKPDNILVCNNYNLVIIDYDGIYFPKMAGQKARELGSPDYRLPERNIFSFDKRIDDFALATIAMSLSAISFEKDKTTSYNHTNELLLTATDNQDVARSERFNHLLKLSQQHKELGRYICAYLAALSNMPLTEKMFDFSDLHQWPCGELSRKDVLWLYTNQQHVYLPRTINSIAKGAFARCNNLEIINIPNSVESIGKDAFVDCRNLRSVTIGNSATKIASGTFFRCCSLESIIIPNSVTKIEDEAFFGCDRLKSIIIPSSISEIGEDAFRACSCLAEVTIPNSVSSMGWGVFRGCISLMSIIIPNSVSTLSNEAFYGCSGLTSINIPNSVTKIGDSAFARCNGLTSVTIDNPNLKIGSSVFEDCFNLERIEIPAGSMAHFQEQLPEFSHLLAENGVNRYWSNTSYDLPF